MGSVQDAPQKANVHLKYVTVLSSRLKHGKIWAEQTSNHSPIID